MVIDIRDVEQQHIQVELLWWPALESGLICGEAQIEVGRFLFVLCESGNGRIEWLEINPITLRNRVFPSELKVGESVVGIVPWPMPPEWCLAE